MDALTFLTRANAALEPLYILCGDEAFLKRQALLAIRQRALGDDQEISTFAGDKTSFAEIFDELDTVPFFQSKRFVVVENADPFVTRFRGELEKKIDKLPGSAVLVLDVKTWAATTRLAKLVSSDATIVCKGPATYKLPAWCGQWATARFQKQLPAPAASLLVDLVGADMGQLDQELDKLSIYVGKRTKIDTDDVDRLVGNSRAESTWKIFDALAAGDIRGAMSILHRLFDQGEEPMRILGAFSMQLRRLAQAARLSAAGLSLGAALERVGVPPFATKGAEQQMRHLGRRRLGQLYDDLLQMNMDLRGNSPLPERTLFERFLLQLARKN